MLVLRGHQAGNENPRQVHFVVRVLGKEGRLLRLVDSALELKSALDLLRREDRIFFVTFERERSCCCPDGPVEIRIDIVDRSTLIEPAGESGKRERLAFASKVVTRVL